MAAYTSTQTGNWASTSTWGGSGPPVSGDTATIAATHTVTVPDGTTAVCGTSPATGGAAALVITGTLVVGGGASGQLTVKGPVTQNSAAVTFNAGSILEFDASGATTPLSQTYAWTSSGFSHGSRDWTLSGSSGLHVTIRSNVGGGNGYIDTGVGYNDSLFFLGTGYCDFQRIGDSVRDAIKLNNTSDASQQIFYHCTWDANCGLVEFAQNVLAAGGWDFQDCQFNQTNCKWQNSGYRSPLLLKTNISPSTGLRKLYRCYFAEAPILVGYLLDIQDCAFARGALAGGNATKWTGCSGSLLRLNQPASTSNSGYTVNGDVSNSFVLFDGGTTSFDTGTATSGAATTLTDSTKVWSSNCWALYTVRITSGTGAGQWRVVSANTATALTVGTWTTNPDATSVYALTPLLDSGTATAGASTTLTDSGKSWGVNVFSTTVASAMLEITGGTGIGQRRLIASNTSTALTVAYRWDTNPDATSTYSIYEDVANNHGIILDSSVVTGTFSLTGTVFQNAGTDTQGDVILHISKTAATFSTNILLPNSMGDSSGTLVTLGGSTNTPPNGDVGPFTVNHNTCFAGAQSPLAISEGGTNLAGTVTSFQSNIIWVETSRSYYAHGGTNGPFAVNDTDHTANVSTSTNDIITTADYNGRFNLSNSSTGDSYCFRHSTAPGTHDVVGDPTFVDKTRSFWKWAINRGSVSTTISGQITDGLAYIKADPTLTRTSLIPYIQAGFAPQNAGLNNAGHDSVTIGAVAYVSSGPPVGVQRIISKIPVFRAAFY